MSEKFTASNGVEVKAIPANGVVDGLELTPSFGKGQTVFEEEMQALREFFLHERDQELGRWRWPEDPRYIVKPVSEHVVCVVNEDEFWERPHGRQGEPGQLRFRDVRDCVTDRPLGDSAARYKRAAWAFWQAHPELMPKPWHDAVEGELWAMGRDDEVDVWLAYGNYESKVYFKRPGSDHFDDNLEAFSADDKGWQEGRRIWPESVES